MKDPFLYIIECIICSGLFLAIYRLCIVRHTAFRVSRRFLLFAMMGACAIPLLQIPVWPSETMVVTFPLIWDIHGDASEVEFRPSSRWRMGMSGEHYRDVMTEKHSKSFVLLDADLSYNLSSHCEINLRLSNLLNEKRYASTMLGDLTRSYSEYRIRPFNAVVEVYYRF